jgi:hypothetical protein
VNSAQTSITTLFTSVEYASPGNFDVFSSDPASLQLTNDFPSDEIQLATSEGQFWYYPSNSPLVNFPLQNAIGTQPTGTAGGIADHLMGGQGFLFTPTLMSGTFASTLISGTVPEPSGLILGAVALAASGAWSIRNRRRGRRVA